MYTFCDWRCFVCENATKKAMNFGIAEILVKKVLGTLSPEEERRLSEWVEASEWHRVAYEDFLSGRSWRRRNELSSGMDTEAMAREVWKEIRRRERRRMSVWAWGAAACVLVAVGVAALVWGTRDEERAEQMAETRAEAMEERPGVVLELASGESVALESMDSVSLLRFKEEGVVNGDGELAYADSAGKKDEVEIHTLWVPRGAEYALALSDGTRIWLNADSRVRYPNRFVGREREVYLEGEAYFEVARDSSRPFVVRTSATEVRVLGTVFNLQAYPEEQQRTTLVAGSVAVRSGNRGVVLRPGEQAVEEGGRISVRKVDVACHTAWLKHQFVFVNTPLEEVLGDLERWYDVEVFVANPSLRDLRFTATFSRYEPLNDILDALALTTHIAFDLNGRSLIVRKE